jgi:hypothetical protein
MVVKMWTVRWWTWTLILGLFCSGHVGGFRLNSFRGVIGHQAVGDMAAVKNVRLLRSRQTTFSSSLTQQSLHPSAALVPFEISGERLAAITLAKYAGLVPTEPAMSPALRASSISWLQTLDDIVGAPILKRGALWVSLFLVGAALHSAEAAISKLSPWKVRYGTLVVRVAWMMLSSVTPE